jgi:hypothetical protein
MSEAATLARNWPWLVTNPVRYTGAGVGDGAGQDAGAEQLVPGEEEADQGDRGDAGPTDR